MGHLKKGPENIKNRIQNGTNLEAFAKFLHLNLNMGFISHDGGICTT